MAYCPIPLTIVITDRKHWQHYLLFTFSDNIINPCLLSLSIVKKYSLNASAWIHLLIIWEIDIVNTILPAITVKTKLCIMVDREILHK
jgi:hypothetical protein